MTPERLELKQWVEKRLYDHYTSLPDCDCMYCDWKRDYLLAVAEVETLHEQAKQGTLEAARQIDALTTENTTLRTRLDSLVTAAEKVEPYLTNIRCDGQDTASGVYVDCKHAKCRAFDALAAAVREAKGEK